MNGQRIEFCKRYAEKNFPGSEFLSSGAKAAVFALPTGNVLKITECGPSIDWLSLCSAFGQTNEFLPRVLADHGVICKSATPLHAFEVEKLMFSGSLSRTDALDQACSEMRSSIVSFNRDFGDLGDREFWQKVAPKIYPVDDGLNPKLRAAVALVIDIAVTHAGGAYPDFTAGSALQNNIMKRADGQEVLMDPVGSLRNTPSMLQSVKAVHAARLAKAVLGRGEDASTLKLHLA